MNKGLINGGQSLAIILLITVDFCLHWKLGSPFFVLLVQFIFTISGLYFILDVTECSQMVLKATLMTIIQVT